MVEIIPESNKDLNKNLFLKELSNIKRKQSAKELVDNIVDDVAGGV